MMISFCFFLFIIFFVFKLLTSGCKGIIISLYGRNKINRRPTGKFGTPDFYYFVLEKLFHVTKPWEGAPKKLFNITKTLLRTFTKLCRPAKPLARTLKAL
jgi:hypothetical protein